MDLPKAILFDLDDTILAHDAVADGVWRTICARYAPSLAGITAERLFSAIDKYRAWYWEDEQRAYRGRMNLKQARRDVAAGAFSILGIRSEALVSEIADAFTEEREQAIQPFPGALDTLRFLRDKNVPLGLVTNGTSEFQRAKITRFGLAPFFVSIAIEGELGIGKPDERPFRHVLGELAVHPEDAWMVGDRLDYDIVGAQRLGILGIWHDWARTGLPRNAAVRPDRIISSLPDLLKPAAGE